MLNRTLKLVIVRITSPISISSSSPISTLIVLCYFKTNFSKQHNTFSTSYFVEYDVTFILYVLEEYDVISLGVTPGSPGEVSIFSPFT